MSHKNIDINNYRCIFRSVFKSFKSSWGEIVHEFTSVTGVAVGHAHFFRTMRKAWEKAMTAENVKAGFIATGISPYNPGAIPDVAYAPAELYVPSEPAPDSPPTDSPPPPEILTAVTLNVTPSTSTYTITGTSASAPCLLEPYHTTTSESPSSVVVNLDIHGNESVVDLPVRLDEQGMLQLLEEQVAPQCYSDPSMSEVDNNTIDESTSESVVKECDAELSLSVIESAITNDQKQLYISAFESGIPIKNDSMYTTWSLYKSQINNGPSKSYAPSNDLLVIPKQEFSKAKRKKSQYFVISSDEAFREKLQQKVEKEKKAALAAEKKHIRELKKEQKMKALEGKKRKSVKVNNK